MRVLLSTTDTIQGSEIIKYIDLVFSNVVIGTNVFSDIGASFTDFFGGTSDIYKGKLSKMREIAISEIKTRATNIGANAIIGLRVDFDEISGKGKSMFMISVSGTAVKVKQGESNKVEHIDDSVISIDDLKTEIARRAVLLKIENGTLPSDDQWESLINNPDYDVAVKLFPLYMFDIGYSGYDSEQRKETSLMRNYDILLSKLERDLVIKLLYEKLLDSKYKDSEKIVKIIYDKYLFEPKLIIGLFEKKRIREAVLCLSAMKEGYTKEDVNLMKQISILIDNIQDTGMVESVKGALMGKSKDVFVCENHHRNNVDDEFCRICGINIKGLTVTDLKRIKIFRDRVGILENLFNSNK